MENRKIRVGITQGDINGVGYEVILKVCQEAGMLELCTPIIYGSPKIASFHRKALELNTNFLTIDQAEDAVDGKVNLVTCIEEEVKIDLGKPTKESGQAALAALERSIIDYRSGLIDVLVTAPINKYTIQSQEFQFPGHTEEGFEVQIAIQSKPALFRFGEVPENVALDAVAAQGSRLFKPVAPAGARQPEKMNHAGDNLYLLSGYPDRIFFEFHQ